MTPLNDVLHKLTNGTWPASSRHGQFDLSSPKVWVVASCRSDFQPAHVQCQNHLFPLFASEQLGELWDEWAADLECKARRRVQAAQKRVLQCQDDSDEEWAESANTHLDQVLAKQHCFNLLLNKGMWSCDVPADGNCALWSALSLEAGWKQNVMKVTKENVHDLRMDARSVC